MLGAFEAVLSNMESAPIYLSEWKLEHQCVSQDGLLSRLGHHYNAEAKRKVCMPKEKRKNVRNTKKSTGCESNSHSGNTVSFSKL